MNWWKGPPWLSKPSNFWHQPTRFAEESDITTGERHNAAVTTLTNIEFCWCNTLLAQYSSFGKLAQVVKCCMRYLNRLRELATLHRSSILEHKYKKTSVHSSVPKQQEAEEIIDHQKTKRESNSTVPRRSHSFVGTANIILNGGRLQNAKIRRRPIYPTVMDNNNFFITNLALDPAMEQFGSSKGVFIQWHSSLYFQRSHQQQSLHKDPGRATPYRIICSMRTCALHR